MGALIGTSVGRGDSHSTLEATTTGPAASDTERVFVPEVAEDVLRLGSTFVACALI